MPVLSIRIAPALHERLMAHCDEKDIRPADLVRDFLARIVDHADDHANKSTPASIPQTQPTPKKPNGVMGIFRSRGWHPLTDEPIPEHTGPIAPPPKRK